MTTTNVGAGISSSRQQSENETVDLNGGANQQESIARLAYALWQNRGCPLGSSDQDWIEAERQLDTPAVASAAAGSSR